MPDTIVKQIVSGDNRFRLSVCQRRDGLFYYRHDWFAEEWDDAPAAWQDGHPPSGIFGTALEAVAEARATISWLRES
jgi:hypothetical protein